MAKQNTKKPLSYSKAITKLLKKIEPEARNHASYVLKRDGLYKAVLRGAFIKAVEFSLTSCRQSDSSVSESTFFASAMLRGICEDLIALKFIRRLKKRQRDEVIAIAMKLHVRKAAREQAKFFAAIRPFQPVLQFKEMEAQEQILKDEITAIGISSGLWHVKGKMPPIEQMAAKVALGSMYDYFYRVASASVHFSPGVIFRSGWGAKADGSDGAFSVKNFARYYLEFNQVYGAFLFCRLCKTFKRELSLSSNFVEAVREIETTLDEIWRWPEALTYEEMNLKPPGVLHRAILKMRFDEKQSVLAKRKKERQKPL